MDWAIVTPGGKVAISKPFSAVAVDVASRIYPVRDGLVNKDIDRIRREKLERELAKALLELALEVDRM